MKTKTILLSTAFTLLSYLPASASGDEKAAEKKAAKSYFSIENQFASKLSSPFFVTQEMTPQTVFIKFHVTNSFDVVIDDIACKNNRLKSHIEKSLASQAIFVDKENVNKSYAIKMTFK